MQASWTLQGEAKQTCPRAIATTPPIAGTALINVSVANQLCVAFFGSGWRMAEFHDGSGGWSWYAYGNVRSDLRLWVYINDQPGNCWNP